jgi:hypothetical protein
MKRLSRSEVITLLAGIPGMVAATSGIALADDAATRRQLKYQDKPGPGGAVCAKCTLFKPPSACSAVPGKISPKGWCVAYVAKS